MKTETEIAKMEKRLAELENELAEIAITKERYATADGIKKAAAELTENFYQMTPAQREIISRLALELAAESIE